MKLGEALNERARLAKSVSEARDLLETSLVIQEGEEPAINPETVVAKALVTVEEIEWLVAAINRTNSQTRVTVEGEEMSLTEALARRDSLAARIALLDHVIRKLAADERGSTFFRRQASELRQVRQMDVADVQTRRDFLAGRRRRLEAVLQQTNWTTDLIE